MVASLAPELSLAVVLVVSVDVVVVAAVVLPVVAVVAVLSLAVLSLLPPQDARSKLTLNPPRTPSKRRGPAMWMRFSALPMGGCVFRRFPWIEYDS